MNKHPYIITISSEKGGVGKTTLASNLAIYLKALREDLPVTIFSFDNHFTIDKMLEITGQTIEGDVNDLLLGSPLSELVHIGQYGVGYIQSSNQLGDIYSRFKGPMNLAKIFAESGHGGIIIIDTRPDLNILTENALYAADQVIIPVKDMASLENCKNIFALFDQRGIDKKSLALLPCLIDSRIKFEGVFKDQKTLLRAFAINRGYRCLDNYISKSPKVESLNTNPDGKIYPILTHAKGTDVYVQFLSLTTDILNVYDKTPDSRASLYHAWLQEKDAKKREAYIARLEGLAEHCYICGKLLAENRDGRGFYFETSDRAARGFLHSDCFSDILSKRLYGVDLNSQAYAAARSIIADRAAKSVSLFFPQPEQNQPELDYRQFTLSGEQVFQKSFEWEPAIAEVGSCNNERLNQFLKKALAGYQGKLRQNSWLAVHPVDDKNPESILQNERYRQLQQIHAEIVETLSFTTN